MPICNRGEAFGTHIIYSNLAFVIFYYVLDIDITTLKTYSKPTKYYCFSILHIRK